MNVHRTGHTKTRTPHVSSYSPAEPASPPHTGQPISARVNVHPLIEKRAYEIHTERGFRQGYALDDWLEAEREILNQNSGQ